MTDRCPGAESADLLETAGAADPTSDIERVVLLDEAGAAIGSAPKSTVHSAQTPRHQAFSVYLVGESGKILFTRRSLSKRAWPGVWTNSCCGHPAPGEEMRDAIARRVRQELGLEIRDLREVLPDFRYRAEDASGVVENEICPVFAARVDEEPRPDPDEVVEWSWVEFGAVLTMARSLPEMLSPWSVLQLKALRNAPAV